MPLVEELEASGKWLFRWRGWLPLPLCLLVLLALQRFAYPHGSHRLDELADAGCLAVSLSGAAIRAVAVGQTPVGTSGRNRKKQRADKLNTTGIYSIVRHPLYLGNFLAALGVFLFPRVWWLPLVFAGLFALYYERIILAEEQFLRERFGQAYLDWANATPAFLPRVRSWRPSDQGFSWRKVLRDEPQTTLVIILAMYCVELAGDYEIDGRLETDPVWNVLLAVALATFLTLRILRKYTTVLQDPRTEAAPAAE